MNHESLQNKLKDLLIFKGVIRTIESSKLSKVKSACLQTYLNDIRLVFNFLKSIDSKGYINDPKVDIPLTDWLIHQLQSSRKGRIGKKLTGGGYSIGFNVVSYNLIIVLLYRLLLEMEICCETSTKQGFGGECTTKQGLGAECTTTSGAEQGSGTTCCSGAAQEVVVVDEAACSASTGAGAAQEDVMVDAFDDDDDEAVALVAATNVAEEADALVTATNVLVAAAAAAAAAAATPAAAAAAAAAGINVDFLTDIKTLRKDIEQMIHPYIKALLARGGLIATTQIYAGFDSEYETLSTLHKTNDLLTVQLAVNVGLSIRIKQIPFSKVSYESISGISYQDLGVDDRLNSLGVGVRAKEVEDEEKVLMGVLQDSLITQVKEIRKMQCYDHDKVILYLIEEIAKTKGVERYVNSDYISYNFPKSSVATYIKYTNVYSSQELVEQIDSMAKRHVEDKATYLTLLLSRIRGWCNLGVCKDRDLDADVVVLEDVVEEDERVLLTKMQNAFSKPCSRIGLRFKNDSLSKFNLSKLNISTYRLMYVVTHESAADLSLLADFDELKYKLDLVRGCFVTAGKALISETWRSRVHFRDTKLLVPGFGSKSLASIGKIYGSDYQKVDIGLYRQGKMRLLMEEDKDLFERYAIQDSIITLKHATSMDEFAFKYGMKGVPLTLSTIGRSYIEDSWAKDGYGGYQIKNKYVSLADIKLTPKGLRSYEIVKYMGLFLASYRGGRNETFMYGIERLKGGGVWIDYDLTSCYTSVMSILGAPDYNKFRRLSQGELDSLNDISLITNYLVIDVVFSYREQTVYPGIPCTVSDEIDIYPLEGRSVITGSEYLVAKRRGCKLTVLDCIMVPFEGALTDRGDSGKSLDDYVKCYKTPFRRAMKDIQGLRRKYEKGTFENLMYKEIGNSVYGQTSMGLSGKKTLDSKTNTMVVVQGNILSNPLIASYITGFTRALIGECLDNIQKLGGRVVSVTTDGFITDMEDLESKLLSLDDDQTICLRTYVAIRKILTSVKTGKGEVGEILTSVKTGKGEAEEVVEGEEAAETSNAKALEVKHIESVGLITWKTRGQLGMGSGLAAATGFQRHNLESEFLVEEFERILDTDSKNVEFIQCSLRRGNDVYKYGGHVQMVYKDRKFSLVYDNKRRIVDGDLRLSLLESEPWRDVKGLQRIRYLSNTSKTPVYDPNWLISGNKTHRCHIETGVRSFIKVLYNDSERYGIEKGAFKTYNSVIKFIYGYGPAREVKLTEASISKLKHRNTISRAVPRTVDNEDFIQYVKGMFPTFDADLFFKELSTEKHREKLAKREASKVAVVDAVVDTD